MTTHTHTHTPTATATPTGRGESAVAEAVAAALTDLGIPVEPPHRPSTASSATRDPAWAGGVHITPAADCSGLIVAWRLTEPRDVDPHEFARRSVILDCLNNALGQVLAILGWNVHPWDDGASHLLAGRRPLAALNTYPASPA